MRITFVISTPSHPINSTVQSWIEMSGELHSCEIVHDPDQCGGGDLCFLISCSSLVDKAVLSKYRNVLVIHASDLPIGRGWSPHVHSLIQGHNELCVSLLEAAPGVDSGDIWTKVRTPILPHYLLSDVLKILSQVHLQLIDYAVQNFNRVRPRPQSKDIEPTYLARRQPEDSELDINSSIADQFHLIRACDNERFPAFFKIYGKKFILKIERIDNEEEPEH